MVVSIPRVATFTCDDPIPYEASLRGAKVDLSISAKGCFRGELVQVDLNQVWMQQGRENLPRVAHARMDKQRVGIIFNVEPSQSPGFYSGMELDANAIFVFGPGASAHVRTSKPHSWGAMSAPTETLSVASHALVGHELTNGPPSSCCVRTLITWSD